MIQIGSKNILNIIGFICFKNSLALSKAFTIYAKSKMFTS